MCLISYLPVVLHAFLLFVLLVLSMDKLSISILDIPVNNLNERLNTLKTLGIKNIHIDIIDTSFGDTISFGVSAVNYILTLDFTFDIHLMISNPIKLLNKLKIPRNTMITVHLDASSTYRQVIEQFPSLRVGVALNPNEEVSLIEKDLKVISHVLVMSVVPGCGGQKFICSVTQKVEKLKNMNVLVGVDGGINNENIKQVSRADFIIVGSFITKTNENVANQINLLTEALKNNKSEL